jgi:peptidoglycan/LPS O-acetylase OafA/YrhL
MRDERLDFIRGFAAVSFVTAHFEAFTWFNFIFWERLGIFSGAGLFMIISGLLVGMTNRELINRHEGIGHSYRRSVRRSFEIYRAYVVLIALVGLVAAVGYYARYELAAWFARAPQRKLLVLVPAILIMTAGFLFAQTTDNRSFPAGTRLDFLSPAEFRFIYDHWFEKNSLLPLRVLNAVSFLICFYLLLTRFWRPLRKAFGWFLIPLGQASLYVFLVHVVLIAAADQIPGFFDGVPMFSWSTIWFNSAVLLAILVALWGMVKTRFLFRIIPT